MKIRKFVAIISIFLINCFALYAQKTVKVGLFELDHYMYKNPRYSGFCGYAYDYLQEIAAIDGWSYEYVFSNLSVLTQKLEDGDIDILPCISKSDDRENKMLFPEHPMAKEKYIIVKKDNDRILISDEPVSSYQGKTIVTVDQAYQNSFLENWMKENNLQMNVIYTDKFDSLWKILNEGKADYALGVDEAAPIMNSKIFELGKGNSYIAVSKKRPDLLEKINYAQETIEKDKPALMGDLEQKYFNNVLSKYAVTQQESAFFEKTKKITFGGLLNDSPYTYRNSNGEVIGIIPEIINLIQKTFNTNIEVEWKLYNKMSDLQDALNNYEIDVLTPAYYDYGLAERNNVHISKVILPIYMGMLYKGTTAPEHIETIAASGTRLGIHYVTEFYPDSVYRFRSTVKQMIDCVRKNEADVAISNTSVLEYFAQSFHFDYTITTLSTPCNICFATRIDDNELLTFLNHGLNTLTSNDITSLEVEFTNNSVYNITFNIVLQKYKFAFIVILLLIVLFIVIIVQEHMNNKKMEKANQYKTNFLSNMSHDVRTPMNAIIGFTNMAMKNINDRETALELLKKSQTSSTMLLSLLNKILDMNQIDNGDFKLVENKVDMERAGDNLLPILYELANEKDVRLSFSVDKCEDRFVYMDVVRTNQIMMNLVTNAIKYTNPGGHVEVIIHQIYGNVPSDDYALYEFVVKDNGIGMSKEFQKKMFDLFARERNSTMSGVEGTGLGLSIVKKLVSIMNGTIDVESAYSLGTTFTLHIPFKKQDGQEHENMIQQNIQPKVNFLGIKALLVEDNSFNQEITIDILEDIGILTDTVSNGKEALDKIDLMGADFYDIIFMDIQMPVMDGLEATRKIRELYPEVHIPIVALSANAFEEDKKRSFEAGVNDHLIKPIDINTLVDTLCRFV